ncbi:MAG: hypothetical protein AAF943_17955 [Pseudomonadota bacterium]
MTSGLTEALDRFRSPSPDTIRASVLTQWLNSWPDPLLAEEMMSNERVATRMFEKMCDDLGAPSKVGTLSAESEKVIGCLMTFDAPAFALRVGAAFHRATVLNWLTWNTLGQHVPALDIADLRPLLSQVSAQLSQSAGAPATAQQDLSAAQIEEDGQSCIGAWITGQPPAIFGRLSLFCDVPQGPLNFGKAALVQKVAEIMTAEEDG